MGAFRYFRGNTTIVENETSTGYVPLKGCILFFVVCEREEKTDETILYSRGSNRRSSG